MIGGSALLGVGAAFSWGVGDFTARFLGRSIGVPHALFGVMLLGSVVLGLYIAVSGETIPWDSAGLWLLVLNGVATTVGTLMVFEALTSGPVSLASPLAASFPAFAVPMTVALGARPEPIQWGAMVATLGGVWFVARAVSRIEAGDKSDYAPAVQRRTIILAVGSAVVFAVALLSADHAVERYGLPLTLLSGRLIGVLVLGAGFLAMRRMPHMPLKAWPLIVLLALMDTLAFVLIYSGLAMENGEFAIVTSSAYPVVTILLARIFMREQVVPLQWLGVAIVIAGIGTLSATG